MAQQCPDAFVGRYAGDSPIFVGVDLGEAKPFVAAVSEGGSRIKPTTAVYTRRRYYYDTKLRIRYNWEKRRRVEVAGLQAALDALGAPGSSTCGACLQAWTSYISAEATHEEVLRAEFVEYKGRALWRMRAYRLSRRSLDRAVGALLRTGASGRHMVVGLGDLSATATARPGRLPAPTSKIAVAFRRQAHRCGRVVHLVAVNEAFTTQRCCACCKVTAPAPCPRKRMDALGRIRRSGRVRLCRDCGDTPGDKLRDRDVQGARNILWLTWQKYFEAGSLGYMGS